MSTMFVDHYAVLGVSRDASIKEINDAWKKIALKYHPDKCNHSEDGIEKFRTGREAVETLRDPLLRGALDRQLEAQASYHRASETGRGRYPPQPSAGYSQPMNSQSYYSAGPRRSYSTWSEAEMDEIFERAKVRERERVAAAARKAARAEAKRAAYREKVLARERKHSTVKVRKATQAEAEPETSREQGEARKAFQAEAEPETSREQVEAREEERVAAEAPKAVQAEAEPETSREQAEAHERERVAAEACKAVQAEAEPETYREQVKPVKRPWGGDHYASIELEERKARAERRKEGFRALVMRDEEELTAESDKMEGDDSLMRNPGTFSIGDTSVTVYQSTSAVHKRAQSSLRSSSDCKNLSSHWGGSYLADLVVEEDMHGLETFYYEGICNPWDVPLPTDPVDGHQIENTNGLDTFGYDIDYDGMYSFLDAPLLSDPVVRYQIENTNRLDSIDGPAAVPYHVASSSGPRMLC